jgi:hypothetical protein
VAPSSAAVEVFTSASARADWMADRAVSSDAGRCAHPATASVAAKARSADPARRGILGMA